MDHLFCRRYHSCRRRSVLTVCRRNLSSVHRKEQQPISFSLRSSRTSRHVFLSAIVLGVGVSLYTRHWRNQKLDQLTFYDANLSSPQPLPRPPEELLRVVERAGLMGRPGVKSVKDELEDIRQWHKEHNYKGGLVLRELLQPLYERGDHSLDGESTGDVGQVPIGSRGITNLNLARRECYYLYYEITPNGEIKHEIFCRGTTLGIDILTSLTTWMEYDEELGCRVHMGFNRQATHILEDILPLMAPPGPRTTVRVSGHSLGGAVAFLLAAKLRLKGYRVVQVTGVEAPRICATQDSAATLQSQLPSDTLRIENDTDPVPLLPPFGYGVGNKLYLVDSIGKAAYLPAYPNNTDTCWTDSVFVNARIWEIVSTRGRTHRVPYILSQIKQVLEKTKDGGA